MKTGKIPWEDDEMPTGEAIARRCRHEEKEALTRFTLLLASTVIVILSLVALGFFGIAWIIVNPLPSAWIALLIGLFICAASKGNNNG